jgi:hypothetical protein
MQLLIVHEDAEVGEQLMSMVKDSTAHQCDLVESDAAALRWAREHARGGLLFAQLEGPAVGGSLGEILPGLQTLFFPAYPAPEQQIEIAKTKVFPEPIDDERLLEAIETVAEPGPDGPDFFMTERTPPQKKRGFFGALRRSGGGSGAPSSDVSYLSRKVSGPLLPSCDGAPDPPGHFDASQDPSFFST